MDLAAVVMFLIGLLATKIGLSGVVLQIINSVVAWGIAQIPQDRLQEWGKTLVNELVKHILAQGIPPSQIPEEINRSPWFPNPLPQVGPPDDGQPGP